MTPKSAEIVEAWQCASRCVLTSNEISALSSRGPTYERDKVVLSSRARKNTAERNRRVTRSSCLGRLPMALLCNEAAVAGPYSTLAADSGRGARGARPRSRPRPQAGESDVGAASCLHGARCASIERLSVARRNQMYSILAAMQPLKTNEAADGVALGHAVWQPFPSCASIGIDGGDRSQGQASCSHLCTLSTHKTSDDVPDTHAICPWLRSLAHTHTLSLWWLLPLSVTSVVNSVADVRRPTSSRHDSQPSLPKQDHAIDIIGLACTLAHPRGPALGSAWMSWYCIVGRGTTINISLQARAAAVSLCHLPSRARASLCSSRGPSSQVATRQHH